MVYSLYRDNSLTYDNMADEDIIDAIRGNHPLALEFLIDKYKNFVKNKARTYFLIGADRDDIIQEGMIGLFKAIRDYDKTKLASFKSFAEICITRQIITAIKTATRQKHIPLNSYISLNKPLFDQESERTLLDILEGSRDPDPLDVFISREELDVLEVQIDEMLSELEWEVLRKYIEGKSYHEISNEINRDAKCIDNALQRVKKKLEKHLKEQS
ncbi:MAG TPA: RNA polymerase sporulation sigma factor SigH [Tissierellaceae bacterium]|nr:RNA polymerase sporulation sigma factor SigH [Tissierellaceae bacterium]